MSWLVNCKSSQKNCLFSSFVHFLIGLLFATAFYLAYLGNYKQDVWFAKISSCSIGCHFILLILSFAVKKLHCPGLKFSCSFFFFACLSLLLKPLLFQFRYCVLTKWGSLIAQWIKNLPTIQETQFSSLDWEDPQEKKMATHSSILACRISWIEEAGGLQSMGSQELDTTQQLNYYYHYYCVLRLFDSCLVFIFSVTQFKF